MLEICFLCLKNENLKVARKGFENDELLNKLEVLVPEVEWILTIRICENCAKDLNKAYDFKKLCINSYTSLKTISLRDVAVDDYDDNGAPDDITYINNHECGVCKRLFKTKTGLERHATGYHKAEEKNSSTPKILCEICGSVHNTKTSLKKHAVVCKKKIKDETLERTHLLNGDDSQLKVLPTCVLCGTMFKNNYLLKRHSQNVHATEKKFKCDMCSRSFVSSVYLKAHKRYHSRNRSHICSFCGKGFITTSDLYHHEKIHANKRDYQCEICPKAFNTSSDLHKHKICVHSDRADWKYVCTYCQRRFPLKTNLDAHVKTHTGEKNYACHLCLRKCVNKSILMRHIETHSNALAFKCNVCLQGYKYRKSLNVHMAKVHKIGGTEVLQSVRKFICHLCPKSYFANNKLQKHIRAHIGERPFKCPNCSKSFVDKSYVKQHLKTSHNVDIENTEF